MAQAAQSVDMQSTDAGIPNGRGRQAERPGEITRRGWRDILLRAKDSITDNDLAMVSASIAFYGLLALFPAIAGFIAVGGLVLDPMQVEQHIESVSSLLPPQAAGIIVDQARQVVSGSGGGVALAALVGLVVTLYSASKGMKALIKGLNVIYNEDEKRGFIMLNLLAFGLTLGLILVMVVALALIAVVPAALSFLGLGTVLSWLVSLARWPALFAVSMIGLGIVYGFGPSRSRPRWQWVSWGAVVATVLWLLGSILFSAYVRHFGSFNETYGSLGAVVILLTWFWLSAFVVLLGGQLNAEMEHQTALDSTLGDPRPMGRRGAYVADTLGEQP